MRGRRGIIGRILRRRRGAFRRTFRCVCLQLRHKGGERAVQRRYWGFQRQMNFGQGRTKRTGHHGPQPGLRSGQAVKQSLQARRIAARRQVVADFPQDADLFTKQPGYGIQPDSRGVGNSRRPAKIGKHPRLRNRRLCPRAGGISHADKQSIRRAGQVSSGFPVAAQGARKRIGKAGLIVGQSLQRGDNFRRRTAKISNEIPQALRNIAPPVCRARGFGLCRLHRVQHRGKPGLRRVRKRRRRRREGGDLRQHLIHHARHADKCREELAPGFRGQVQTGHHRAVFVPRPGHRAAQCLKRRCRLPDRRRVAFCLAVKRLIIGVGRAAECVQPAEGIRQLGRHVGPGQPHGAECQPKGVGHAVDGRQGF